MNERITGRLSDDTVFVRSETGNEGVGYFTTQRRLPEIITKLAKLEDKIEQGELVEVVKCKACKHFCPYEGEEHKGDCAELVGLESCVYEDDFCSYGERKID